MGCFVTSPPVSLALYFELTLAMRAIDFPSYSKSLPGKPKYSAFAFHTDGIELCLQAPT